MEKPENRIISKTLTMKQMSIIFCVLLGCCIALIVVFANLSDPGQIKAASTNISSKSDFNKPAQLINEIPLPGGYKRTLVSEGSFAEWLRNVKLCKDNTVYLYNGSPKTNQTLHYAVLDFSTGKKDLQQCADAIMRLRAEYYFSRKEYAKIDFKSVQSGFNFQQWLAHIDSSEKDYHVLLLQFMQNVFINCGTYTVEAMTKQISMKEIQPGDVFVKAGAPGHAMIVADVAVNEKTGEKIYLLAQSFMPAQDMHIVINPSSSTINPWYEVNKDEKIITPGWAFTKDQLKRFTAP